MLRQLSYLFLIFLTSGSVSAQTWSLMYEIPIDSGAVWSADQNQQVYIFQKQSLSKWDKTGKKMLEQSIKEIGDINSIYASNLLKIAVFSENQQQLCFLDNALALETDCIQLSDYDQEWATLCCPSNQTDRFWSYDQVNSELSLLTTKSEQRQIIQNVRDLTGLGNIVQMEEQWNALYLLDDQNKMAVLDIYGTLTHTFQYNSSASICITETGIFSIEGKDVYAEYNVQTGMVVDHMATHLEPIEIPENPVKLVVSGRYCFLSTNTAIYCYKL